MHRWKHHDPKPLHSGRGKGGKEGKVVKSKEQAIAIALSMAGRSKDHSERLNSLGFSEESVRSVNEILSGNFDFTLCQRPNGSLYGTSGKCRKGSEVNPKESRPGTSSGGGSKKTLSEMDAHIKSLYKKETEARNNGDDSKAREYMRESVKVLKALNERRDLLNQRLRELQDKMDDAVTIRDQQRLSTAVSSILSELSGLKG